MHASLELITEWCNRCECNSGVFTPNASETLRNGMSDRMIAMLTRKWRALCQLRFEAFGKVVNRETLRE